MGELNKNPIHNVFKVYRKMNLVNPYRFGSVGLDVSGLYFYLKFNGNALDSSTSPKTTYIGSAFTYQNGLYSGVSNNCVLYDSTSQIVTVDNTSGKFSFGNSVTDVDFSLGCIIKPSTNGARRTLLAKGNFRDGLTREYLLELQSNNTLLFQVYDQSATAYKRVVTTATFTSGNIYNIDAVYASGILYLYIDGVLQTVTTSTSGTYVAMEVHNIRLQIGKHLSFNDFLFRGNMDEVQVWSRALPSGEILAKHNMFVAGTPLI